MKRLNIILGLLVFSIATAYADGVKANSCEDAANKAETEQSIMKEVNEAVSKNAVIDIRKADSVGFLGIPEDTKKSFFEELKYPKDLRGQNERDMVIVSFTYDEDGYIRILNSHASNEDLNIFVKNKLENIRLRDGIITVGKEYIAKFHFKLL